MNGNDTATIKSENQFTNTAIDVALPLLSDLNSSAVISHGIAPNILNFLKKFFIYFFMINNKPGPIEKKTMYNKADTTVK